MTDALQLEIGAHVVTLDEANRRLKEAIDIRVDVHDRRCRPEPTISVDQYLAALRWVREVEDALEPIRRAAGFTWSRAGELCSCRTDGYKDPEGPWA